MFNKTYHTVLLLHLWVPTRWYLSVFALWDVKDVDRGSFDWTKWCWSEDIFLVNMSLSKVKHNSSSFSSKLKERVSKQGVSSKLGWRCMGENVTGMLAKEWPEIPSKYELVNTCDGGQVEQRLASNIHVWKSVGCQLQYDRHDMNNATLHTLGSGHLPWHACMAKP
jgi:hypothetical protein